MAPLVLSVPAAGTWHQCQQRSMSISHPQGAQQQTRRPLLLSNNDRQMDGQALSRNVRIKFRELLQMGVCPAKKNLCGQLQQDDGIKLRNKHRQYPHVSFDDLCSAASQHHLLLRVFILHRQTQLLLEFVQ